MVERSVAVLVPVLRRPERVKPLITSLNDSVRQEAADGWTILLTFVCSASDGNELQMLRRSLQNPIVAPWSHLERSDYARKINLGARSTDSEWLFTGADDLNFHAGWLTNAVAKHEETGALVVGTNDLCNPTVIRGEAATHSLVHRSWLEHAVVDSPGDLLCELYDHNCVDVELTETAKAAGTWVFAENSHVEHLHWMRRRAKRDWTYKKGIRYAREDRKLLNERRALWNGAVDGVRR